MGSKYTKKEIRRKKLVLEAKALGIDESEVEDWMSRKDLKNLSYIKAREKSIRRAEEIRAERDKLFREMDEQRELLKRKMEDVEGTTEYIKKQQRIYDDYFTGRNCKRQLRLNGYNI